MDEAKDPFSRLSSTKRRVTFVTMTRSATAHRGREPDKPAKNTKAPTGKRPRARKGEGMTEDRILKIVYKEMKRQKVTQMEMARRIGVTNVAICNWTHGRRNPHLSYVCGMLDALGLEIRIVRKK